MKLKVIGIPEAKEAIRRYGFQLKPVTMDGLVKGVNAVIEQARTNLYGHPPARRYRRTGRLGASLRILNQQQTGSIIVVEAGSDLEYGFYQEYGWTSRAGRQIPGKLFFTKAVETQRPRFLELLATTIKAGVPWGK